MDGTVSSTDEAQIPLTNALSGRARKVLMAMKKKGKTINTWVDCYTTKATAILDDGERYSLRREVTHAMQNAADAASRQFSNMESRSYKGQRGYSALRQSKIVKVVFSGVLFKPLIWFESLSSLTGLT